MCDEICIPSPVTYDLLAMNQLVALPEEIRQAVKRYLYVAASLSLMDSRPAFTAVTFVGGARLHYEFSPEQRTLSVSRIVQPVVDEPVWA